MVLVVVGRRHFAALSTSCLLSFLLTVVHLQFFLLLRHVFSDAAVDRSHVVTLTIIKTVRPSLFLCIL